MIQSEVGRAWLHSILEVPYTDILIGLCQIRPVRYARREIPMYNTVEALQTLRAWYEAAENENRENYEKTNMESLYERACKYHARQKSCEAVLAMIERGDEDGTKEGLQHV